MRTTAILRGLPALGLTGTMRRRAIPVLGALAVLLAATPGIQALPVPVVVVGLDCDACPHIAVCLECETGDGGGGGGTTPAALHSGHVHITIHRFSAAGIRLLVAPAAAQGWVCRDMVAAGTPVVTAGSDLQGPNPNVQCTPPSGSTPPDCETVNAGGYHAASGGGVLTVWSECS